MKIKKVNFVKHKAFLCIVFLSFFTTMAFAQNFTVTGTVTDDLGEPLIGATVLVKGTTNGMVTDIDGKFSLSQVTAGSVLHVSFVGFTTQELPVGNNRTFTIRLTGDTQLMDELVVIGYGVQKKALVTGATINVSGESIQKMSANNAFTALQSQSPGVSITQNNGEPGSSFIVNIRGIATNGESRPLYIIDGVPSGHNGLNNMNPADIETIDILKDAASAAIYGARAANGVVLITTKQGKAGRTRITYDGYMGWQYMIKKPDMMNAKQYIEYQDLLSDEIGTTRYDWKWGLPTRIYNDVMSGKWEGTDWIDVFYNKAAPYQNHAMNLTGGNDVSKFAIGYSYSTQEGILGEKMPSFSNRHTVRINTDHVLLKGNGFDAIKIGQTLNYMYRTSRGMRNGNRDWNSFRPLLSANPLAPAYNENGGYYDYYDKIKEENGFNFDYGNPVGSYATSTAANNLQKNHNLNMSVYLEIRPIKNLRFRSQYNYRMDAQSRREMDLISRFSSTTVGTIEEEVRQSGNMGYAWSLSNTLQYDFSYGQHGGDILIGQEMEKSGYGESWNTGAKVSSFNLGWDYGWVGNMSPILKDDISYGGSPRGESAIASFFGRINYNFKETYMLTLIMRGDGSSNFAPGKRWGYFPSVSAGWVLTNEAFMEPLTDIVNFLRLRANWGQNGNQSITAFQYLTRYRIGNASDAYYFGTDKRTVFAGASPSVYRNPDVTWETSEQAAVGLDLRFLNNRLGVVFDWYQKDTKGWLLAAPISNTWGYSAPDMNGGSVRNTGAELSLNWNDRIGRDFSYRVSVNGDVNTNKVTEISNEKGFIAGADNVLATSTTEFYRLEVGRPMGFFYGFVHDGIFQTPEEVQAHVNSKGVVIQPDAVPGDIRFKDLDDNGVIQVEGDKTMIGNGHPKYSLGLSLGMEYKGFDIMATASGKFKFDIAKAYYNFASGRDGNREMSAFDNRWTGPGSTNFWHRMVSPGHPNTSNLSKLYMEKGDYLKIQNVTLGYNFKRLFPQIPLASLRFYGTINNLFTFTKYSGMDPEIGGDTMLGRTWVNSIDLGYYPASRTILFGVSASF